MNKSLSIIAVLIISFFFSISSFAEVGTKTLTGSSDSEGTSSNCLECINAKQSNVILSANTNNRKQVVCDSIKKCGTDSKRRDRRAVDEGK